MTRQPFLHSVRITLFPDFCRRPFLDEVVCERFQPFLWTSFFRVGNARNKSLAQCTTEFTVTCKKFLDLLSTNKMMTAAVFFSILLPWRSKLILWVCSSCVLQEERKMPSRVLRLKILSELHSTDKWERLFRVLEECICVGAFHLRNWTSAWKQQKKECVTICILLSASEEKVHFFVNCMPPTRIWPLPKPTTEKVDLT